jgi:Tfp pilus assembly protein PilW
MSHLYRRHQSFNPGTAAGGFTLVELLVALTVCLLIAGALAAVTPAARAAFESTPEALDLQQRARTGADVLIGALRSAGGPLRTALVPHAAAAFVPGVMLLAPRDGGTGTQFESVFVIAPSGTAQAILVLDQPWPGGPLTLSRTGRCPQDGDVCGFREGATGAVVDSTGRFDIFTVTATDAAMDMVFVSPPFAAAYPAGAAVLEVEAVTFRLEEQPDASLTLVRDTAAGATQPIVDFLTAATFEGWRSTGDPLALEPLTAAGLEDGPWQAGGPDGRYDTDLRGLRRVDVMLRFQVRSAVLRGPAGQLFDRGGGAGHAPLRWVPDRTVQTSITLRNAS